MDAFARLGEQGVLALLGDSTNAEAPGTTASESTVSHAFHQIFAEAEGRVIVASFASHIHRIQQAITIAHLHGRKFALSGRSMVKNANIARNLGYLKVPEGAMIKLLGVIAATLCVIIGVGFIMARLSRCRKCRRWHESEAEAEACRDSKL